MSSRFVIEKIEVTVYYGPYDVGGIVKHRTERLHNLIEKLKSTGFSITLRRTTHRNRVSLVINGVSAFICNIKYLQYPHLPDPVAEEACDTVLRTVSSRAGSNRSIRYTRSSIEDVIKYPPGKYLL